MSLYKDMTHLKDMFEKDVFKPASGKELAQRQTAWQKDLLKKGVKIKYLVKPMPNRLSSFWYDGDVATIEYKAPDGDHRRLVLIAAGDIRVTFVDDENSYRDWAAREEAERRGYTDNHLGEAEYEEPQGEFHGRVKEWDNNNWFEFLFESDKWEGAPDISIMEGGETYSDYDEALRAGVEMITNDALWKETTENLEEAKDVFQPASQEELEKRPGWLEAQKEEEEWRAEQAERRRRIARRHLTQPDSRALVDQFVNTGRNKGRAASLSVRGDILYSYGTPIALRQGDLIYVGDDRFSRTTSKQQSYVRREAGPDRLRNVNTAAFIQLLRAQNPYVELGWLRENNANNEDIPNSEGVGKLIYVDGDIGDTNINTPVTEAEDIFKPAGEKELRARGAYRFIPKSGAFEYRFLKYIDNPDTQLNEWQVVGIGNYIDYDASNIYFFKDGEVEFNIYYDTEVALNENMMLDDKLTEEVQSFDGTDDEWVKSKGWKIEFWGTTRNEDPAYYWGYQDFSYVSFEAPKDSDVLGGAVITLPGSKPRVYLGDLYDVLGYLNESESKDNAIAQMFDYAHYTNLVFDIKKYRGTLTPEEEQERRPEEKSPGQYYWPNISTRRGYNQLIPPGEDLAVESVNEKDVFQPASREELTQRQADYDRLEKERKRKQWEERRAYYAGIPYTYDQIAQLPAFTKILELPGIKNATTAIMKDHKTVAFQLSWRERSNNELHQFEYYVYANGYLRMAGWSDISVIKKYEPARTIEEYAGLLEHMYAYLVKKIAKEEAKPPFNTLYACWKCPGSWKPQYELYKHYGDRRDYQPQHRADTVLGRKHLKDPRNAEELKRLQKLAKAAGTEIEL